MKPSQIYQNRPFRQSTLAELRWVAIVGQYISVAVAYFVLRLEFEIIPVLLVITLWLAINIIQQTVFADQLRLNARRSIWVLGIDLAEMGAVLFFTGGLNNPFIVFLIVPSILAATNLRAHALNWLIVATIILLTLLAWQAEPMAYRGQLLALPPLLQIGVYISVIVLLLFLAFFARRIATENLNLLEALAASEMALQREHRLSSLGALVAAYAHELGTPLATIRFTASDLLETKLAKQSRQDVETILEEAKRSGEILASMGQRGKTDQFVQTVPFMALVEEAAIPHMDRGKAIEFIVDDPERLIYVERSEALVQGLRNIIQNAVDFASEVVIIERSIEGNFLSLRISDDGAGFPSDILAKIGEPYLRTQISQSRNNYKGMGLGVFIAKTLLERTFATLNFANISEQNGGGAVVSIAWSLKDIEVSKSHAHRALGDNPVTTA